MSIRAPAVLVAVVALVIMPGVGFGQAQSQQRPPAQARQAAGPSMRIEPIDDAHPRYFTQIVEVSGRNDQVNVLTQRDNVGCDTPQPATLTLPTRRRSADEVVNAEADVSSRIRIIFDRCWIRERRLEGVILVRGWVTSGSTTREIEVPGYSEVGKERSPSPALVRSADRLAATLTQLTNEVRRLEANINTAYEQAERDVQLSDSLTRVLNAATRIHDSLSAVAAQSRGRLQELRARLDPAAAPELSAQVEAATSAAFRDSVASEEAARRVEAIRNAPSYRRAVNTTPQFVAKVQAAIGAFRIGVGEPIRSLLAENGFLLQQMARFGTAHPETIGAVAQELVEVLIPNLLQPVAVNDAAAVALFRDRVWLLRQHLHRIREVAGSALPRLDGETAYRVLLGDVRDADILISRTGARSGDYLHLQVADSTPGNSGRRVLDVRIAVREFGFVRSVSDAALLLRRNRVSLRTGDTRLAAARAQFDASGRVDPVEVPLPANYVPAAGASLLWTYYARQGKDGNGFARWLSPGIGVNVSFTNFPSQTVSFSAPDAENAPPRETVTPGKTDVQVAVGPILTLFDNRLLFSTGWNLNVTEYRSYVAVGFSFVNIARRFNLTLGDSQP